MENEKKLAETIPSECLCQVCGEPIKTDDNIILCGKCRTPHHSECFKYVGQCSIYACGGKAAIQNLNSEKAPARVWLKWSDDDYAFFTLSFLLVAAMNQMMGINQVFLVLFLILYPVIIAVLKRSNQKRLP